MKVYRYLSEYELKYIQSDDVDNIGSTYNDDVYKRINTHRYKEGVKYLHFYKNKEDISYIKKCDYLPSGRYYICEFDIPFYILFTGYGKGFYGSFGKIDYTATEYKVPSHLMKSKYLKSYKLDEEYKFSVIDFFEKLQKSFESNRNLGEFENEK